MPNLKTMSLCLLLLSFPSLNMHASETCLPEDGDPQIRAQYESPEALYSHYYYSESDVDVGSYVIRESEGKCEVLLTPDDYSNLPALHLDEHIDSEVAQNLYFDFFRRRIDEAGGLNSFQQAVDESQDTHEPAFSQVSPAELSALEELGVELPEDTVLVSDDSKTNRVYALLTNAASPIFLADDVGDIKFSSDYILANYVMGDAEGVVFAKLLEDGGIQYIFAGLKEEYDPEMLSYEHLIPLRIFEGFEE